jgi:hypothetical protein
MIPLVAGLSTGWARGALEQAFGPPEAGRPKAHDHEKWFPGSRAEIIVGQPDGAIDGEAVAMADVFHRAFTSRNVSHFVVVIDVRMGADDEMERVGLRDRACTCGLVLALSRPHHVSARLNHFHPRGGRRPIRVRRRAQRAGSAYGGVDGGGFVGLAR